MSDSELIRRCRYDTRQLREIGEMRAAHELDQLIDGYAAVITLLDFCDKISPRAVIEASKVREALETGGMPILPKVNADMPPRTRKAAPTAAQRAITAAESTRGRQGKLPRNVSYRPHTPQ